MVYSQTSIIPIPAWEINYVVFATIPGFPAVTTKKTNAPIFDKCRMTNEYNKAHPRDAPQKTR